MTRTVITITEEEMVIRGGLPCPLIKAISEIAKFYDFDVVTAPREGTGLRYTKRKNVQEEEPPRADEREGAD